MTAQPAKAGILIDVAGFAEQGIVATVKFTGRTVWKTTKFIAKSTYKGVKFVAKSTTRACKRHVHTEYLHKKALPAPANKPIDQNRNFTNTNYNKQEDYPDIDPMPQLPKIQDLQED